MHVLIFKCEANWAYAMHMKQVSATGGTFKSNDPNQMNGVQRNPNRVKYHAKMKLKKAFQAAEAISPVARECLDLYS
jgi:hypothetical protein